MTDTPMLTAALSYAARGWQVLPCRPGLKAPLTPHGCKDATTDEATIRAWFDRWPDANVALACGPASGVYVVDVDLDPAKGVNGWDSLKEFPELPATVRQDSPRGGAHFLFKTDTPPRNKNNYRNGIDIRSDGYYIMLAPSVHPNGKVYAWAPDYAPGDIELAEFPDFMRPAAEKPVPPWERARQAPAAPKAPEHPGSTPILERARLYLQECEPAVQGQAGHEALLWAARSLVVGFELGDADALGLLWNDFNPRCNPPWDHTKPSEVKDFERKVAEARRTPGAKPRGWLLDECGLRDAGDAALEYGGRLQSALVASFQAAKIASIPSKHAPQPPKEMPDWILHPPGMVGQLCDWINQTAGCYQPLLALGCALTACGAIFGRKVRDESNGRTNVYAMGVAHSSAGKDHPGDCVERLFALAGASMYLGGSRVTSDTALEMALMAFPIQLFHWDEVGHFFASIKQAGSGSGGAMHLTSIKPALMQLYSSPHKLYIGKQKADGELRRIDQPHVCMWGLTSPDILYQGMSKSELRDGWLGRVVTLISHDRPKYVFQKATPPPESLVQSVMAWAQRTIPAPEGIGNIAAATGTHQIVVPTQPEALKVFEAFIDECYDRMLLCDRVGDDAQYLWGKGVQNARRIALIIAAGDRYDGAEITQFHAEYGCEMIRRNIVTFAKSVEHNLADNAYEHDKQRIFKILKKAGRKGMSQADMTRRTQDFRDKRVRDGYLADLIEAGMVNRGQNPDEPSARAWLWIAPYGIQQEEGKK